MSQTRRGKGFKQAGAVLATRLRGVGEARGFSELRLLTHWTEIAGAGIAAICAPLQVKHGPRGAVLTLATRGPVGPELSLQLEQLRARINAAYGFNAIARITIADRRAVGLAEDAVPFAAKPETVEGEPPARLASLTENISNDTLRSALDRLGAAIAATQTSPQDGRNA